MRAPVPLALLVLLAVGCSGLREGDGIDDYDGGVPDLAVAPVRPCPESPCGSGAVCYKGACVPDEGPCTKDDECQNDSYCQDGRCIGYGPKTKTSDPDCKGGGFVADKFQAPVIKCQWTQMPVIMAPVVADLDGDKKPEIIFISFTNANLIALRGSDCTELWRRTTDLGTRSQLAVADLDGDKKPEIIGVNTNNNVEVFDNTGTLLAKSTDAATTGPTGFRDGGAAIANLDGVGPPEIVYAGLALRYSAGALTRLYNIPVQGGHWGVLSAIADVDLDGKPDIIVGNQILDGLTGADKTPAAVKSFGPGYAAVAQFDPKTPEPEIVLISSQGGQAGTVRIYHPVTGQVVFGPYTFGQQWGGPPTVADFDGDGKPEVGSAGYAGYAVFDPDCAVTPTPAFCQGPGLRWLKQTRDNSSGSTGSSVFDFNGDGQAEVVYRDECWLRVYDGKTGQVRFAQSLTSGTILELPVIADVDGDGHADVVVPTHQLGGCAAEPDLGLPAGPGTNGIQVLMDPKNRWMPSRSIWNQHTYHITNIEDDATVPLKETNNWSSWNNYRQNVQGIIKSDVPAPDLTAARLDSVDAGTNCVTNWVLAAYICNRGANPVGAGVSGTFYTGDPRAGGKKICTGQAQKPIPAGSCEPVRCNYANPPSTAIDLWFVAGDDGTGAVQIDAECKTKNNLLHQAGAVCSKLG